MPKPSDDGFLLSRLRLQLSGAEDLTAQLSAVTFSPEGHLWVGSDELRSVERLSIVAPYSYGERKSFPLDDLLGLSGEDEIDIEGMDYAGGYLYLTGSHSLKRRRARGKQSDAVRLETVVREPNRYLVARVPVVNGELLKSYAPAEGADAPLRAGALPLTDSGNTLTDALRDDPHLGPFLSFPLPGKDNGFDIEGLAVVGERIFLGFRGPVLRGVAVVLEIMLEERGDALELKPLGKGRKKTLYKKHFLNLRGLGVRDLIFCGGDLLVLAGPTMSLEGEMALFRWRKPLEAEGDAALSEGAGLELVFDLPFTVGSDHAEGLALTSSLGEDALMVVYDAPDDARLFAGGVYADAYRI